jgi:iron complex outermembrane receptor protein
MRSSAFKGMLLGCSMLAGTAVHAYAADAQPAPAAATEAAPAADAPAVGEVVVTARRRAEYVQDVPQQVTAVSGQAMQQLGIKNTYDLVRVAPALNVNVSAGGGQSQAQYTIRGQRQGDTPPSLDPSVGTYIGDIVMERPFGFGQMMFDLNNVQVLEGPQGTLFGRNTTGGAILLQPNLPTSDYEAMVHGQLGNYRLGEIDGFVNIPFNDKVALRVAAQHTSRDGYIKDITSDQHDQNENETGVRIALRLRPTDNLENTTVANYVSRNTTGSGFRLLALSTSPTAPAAQIYGATGQAVAAGMNALPWNETATDHPGFSKTKTYTIANTTTYDLGHGLQLKNVLGYVNYQSSMFDDIDGSPLPILAYGLNQNGRQLTEEFQVLGNGHHYNWIAGAYYFRENAYYESNTPEELNPVLLGESIPQSIQEQDHNYSKSVFASGTYDFSDFIHGLSFTAGGRYTWDTRQSQFGTIYAQGFLPGQASGNPIAPISGGQTCGFAGANPPVAFDPATCRTNGKVDFSKFTYNVDIDYKITPDKMIYVAHRLGYRTGGWSTRSINGFDTTFAPETVGDYEVGVKLDWHFNGMFLRTNLAGFYQKYTDIQRLVPLIFPNGSTTAIEQNAASANIQGAEGEFTFVPNRWMTFTGFFSQTQPKYNQFIIHTPTGEAQDVTNTAPFAGFPRTTYGITGRFTLPTPESLGEMVFQANWYHQSAYIAQDSAFPEALGTTPAYGLLNLRLEWNKVQNSNLDLALFANNALNKHYLQVNYSLMNEMGFASGIYGPPAMYGVEATYHFR